MIARRKTEVAFKQNNQPITLLITYPAFSAMLGLLNSRTRTYKVVCNLTAQILIWPWVAMAVNYCYNCRQWGLVLVYLNTCFRVNVDECAAVGQATSYDPNPVGLRSKCAWKCPSRREMWIRVSLSNLHKQNIDFLSSLILSVCMSLGLKCHTTAPECEVPAVTVYMFVSLQFVIYAKQGCI